jgi:ATP-binding cassette, subfamily B, bacterial
MSRYRFIFPYILGQRRFLLLIVILTLFGAALATLQPWPLKILIDFALGDDSFPLFFDATPFNLVIAASVLSLVLYTLNSAVNSVLVWVWTAAGNKMVYHLSVDLFGRLQRLSLLFFQKRHLGDILNRLSGDSYCVYKIAEAVVVAPFRSIVVLTMIGYVSWSLNKELALISFAIAPFLGLSAWYFGGRLKRQSRLDREAHSALMSFVHQTVTAIPMVQAFTAEETNKQKFDALARNAVTIKQKNALVTNTFLSTGGLMTTIGGAIILVVGGNFILNGTLTVGSLLVFIAYLKTMQGAFQNLLTTYGSMKSAEASIDRILEVVNTREKITEVSSPQPFPHNGTVKQPYVRFNKVSFEYRKGVPVLQNIDLEIDKGETIAIVGETGSGKSTLIHLIPRFIDPVKGSITLDGFDLRELSLTDLRAHIALVQQEPFLFPVSVAENIGMGNPDAAPADIREAAVLAGADDFIRKLPDGYQTIVAERGVTLSGGQKQRISIARALVKDAPILLLDEPTSALDVSTEEKLMEAIEILMKGRTTFLIAHRFSTIRNADRIVVLRQGNIDEVGTHNELIAREGVYYRLLSLQQRNADWNEQYNLISRSNGARLIYE